MKTENPSQPPQWKRRNFLLTLLQGSLGAVALTLWDGLPFSTQNLAYAETVETPPQPQPLNDLGKALPTVLQLLMIQSNPAAIILGTLAEVAVDYVISQQFREEELKALRDKNNNEERRLQLLEESLKDRREIAEQQIRLTQESHQTYNKQ